MDENEEDHVRERAYQIWQEDGRPDGKHEEHWQRAMSEHTASPGTAPSAASTLRGVTPDGVPPPSTDRRQV